MQCWNCGFENIPGLQACARCTSVLNLEGVDVEPPRSSTWHVATHLERTRHRLEKVLPAPVRLGARLFHAIPGLAGLVRRLGPVLPAKIPWHALASVVIPGLGHIRTRHARLGWMLLSTWLLFLLLTILTIATSWNGHAVAGLVLVHAIAITALLAEQLAFEGLFFRSLFGLCAFLCLWFFVYGPIGWLATRYYQPFVVPDYWSVAGLARGDGLIMEGPWRRAHPLARGDLVLYEMQGYARLGYQVRAGYGFERIVGVSRDRIQVKSGELLVNGAPPTEGLGPLGSLPARVADFDAVLPPHMYAILPTYIQVAYHGQQAQPWPPDLLSSLTLVPETNIIGSLVIRLRPLSRFGRIE
jgi:hypothetical protein